MSNDHIPTPEFLRPLFEDFFDPYPLHGEGPIEPPSGAKVLVNPGFSRKQEAWENAQRWAKEGHYVVCYLPVESSTKLGFDIAKKSPPPSDVRQPPLSGMQGHRVDHLGAGNMSAGVWHVEGGPAE